MTRGGGTCGTLSMLHVIGKRWTIPILESFSSYNDAMQFNTMQQTLKGITPKNLSNGLKELCELEIVERREKSYAGLTRTEYSLSKKGILIQKFIRDTKMLGVCIYGVDSSCVKRKCIDCPLFNAK